MASFVVSVEPYYRPRFDLEPETTLADALETAAWALTQYRPTDLKNFAGYSHNVYLTYTDDDGNETTLRHWRYKIYSGTGYWDLITINEVPSDE